MHILREDWSSVYDKLDTNESYVEFLSIFTKWVITVRSPSGPQMSTFQNFLGRTPSTPYFLASVLPACAARHSEAHNGDSEQLLVHDGEKGQCYLMVYATQEFWTAVPNFKKLYSQHESVGYNLVM